MGNSSKWLKMSWFMMSLWKLRASGCLRGGGIPHYSSISSIGSRFANRICGTSCLTAEFKSYLTLENMPKTSKKITIGIAVMTQAATDVLERARKENMVTGAVRDTKKAVMTGNASASAMKCVFRKSTTVLL